MELDPAQLSARLRELRNGQTPFGEIVLSLDGGGVRGYSSLLIIKRLMDEIQQEEHRIQELAHPDHFDFPEEPLRPCEYFDYIFGTSTGGLIAILLARLSLNVFDCLEEYRALIREIFRHKKWASRLRLGPRYSSSNAEAVFKGAIARHTAFEQGIAPMIARAPAETLEAQGGVFSVYSEEDRDNPYTTTRVFLHRTYHYTGAPPDPLSRVGSNFDALNSAHHINDRIRIHEAARATSAAPGYFDELRIDNDRFMDAGVMVNNPCLRAFNEASNMHEARPRDEIQNSPESGIGMLVSIGTGRKKKRPWFVPRQKWFRPFKPYHWARAAGSMATDVEEKHREMKAAAKREKFLYYRLNVEEMRRDDESLAPDQRVDLTGVKMDDCRDSTIQHMDRVTEHYLNHRQVRTDIRYCAKLLVAHKHGRELCRNGASPKPSEKTRLPDDDDDDDDDLPTPPFLTPKDTFSSDRSGGAVNTTAPQEKPPAVSRPSMLSREHVHGGTSSETLQLNQRLSAASSFASSEGGVTLSSRARSVPLISSILKRGSTAGVEHS